MTDGRFLSTEKSPRVWQPVELHGSMTVATGMAVPVLEHRLGNRIWGEPINSLSPLPPEDHFRSEMFRGAKIFVERMTKMRERYRLHTNEGELRITGPFMHKRYGSTESKATTFTQGEWLDPDALDFRISGWFIAEYGFLVDSDPERDRDLVQAVSVAEWQRMEDIAWAAAQRQHGQQVRW